MAYTVNFMVGTGFLTLPRAVVDSGLVLGTFVLFGTGLLSIIASDCTLEALARAGPILKLRTPRATGLAGQISRENSDSAFPYGAVLEPEEESDEDKEKKSSTLRGVAGSLGEEPWLLGQGRIEMPQLVHIFLGESGSRAYVGLVIIYIYAAMWAYCVLVASTLSTALPLTGNETEGKLYSYWLYLVSFGLMTTFFSTRDLTGPFMSSLNIAFTYGRMAMVLAVTVTLSHGLWRAYFDDNDDASGGNYGFLGGGGGPTGLGSDLADGVYEPSAPAPLWRPEGLPTMLPTTIYSLIFHYSIPTLAEPMRDKKMVGSAFSMSVLVTVVAYWLISVAAGAYFGGDTMPAVSLNWASYRPAGAFAPFGAVVRNFVVFFPALSLVSSYPLLAITLSNNMEAVSTLELPRSAWRVLAAAPPVVISVFVTDLTTVTAVAGLFGYIVVLIFPLLLQRASARACSELLGPGRDATAYSTVFTSSPCALAVCGAVVGVVTTGSAFSLVGTLVVAPLFAPAEDAASPWP